MTIGVILAGLLGLVGQLVGLVGLPGFPTFTAAKSFLNKKQINKIRKR